MRTYTDRAQMDERYQRTIVQLMESQAYRELAAAWLFGYGLQFAPELRWIKFMTWHIREEVDHFDAVARMYRSFTGEDVTPVAMARLHAKPLDLVDSWFELAMAQFLFDRGGNERPTMDYVINSLRLGYMLYSPSGSGFFRGNVELLDIEEGVVTLRMMGACGGCPMSTMTLKRGIEQRLRELVPGIERVDAI